MQQRTLLILGSLVLVLAVFILIFERDLPSTDERSELEARVLPLEGDTIDQLTLEWGQQRTLLVRQWPTTDTADPATASPAKSQWLLTEPTTARASASQVETLLTKLLELRHQRLLENLDRGAAGLEVPRGRLRVSSGDQETVLEFGPAVPAAQALLVAITGRPEIYQISDSLIVDLERPSGDWRDPQILGLERSEIDYLTLEHAGERVSLRRQGERFWLDSPLQDRADRDAVAGLLAAVVGLRAESFLDRLPATLELGFDSSADLLEVATTDGQIWRVTLGSLAPSGHRYGRLLAESPSSGGLTFETAAQLDNSFARSAADWRSPVWSALESYQITAFKLHDGAGVMSFELRDGDWHRGEEALDYALVSDLLFLVTAARAERLLDQAQATAAGLGQGTAALEIELVSRDLDQQTLRLWQPIGEAAAAADGERSTWLMIETATAQQILDAASALRHAKAAAEPADSRGE